jgi:hypothetical protein
MPRGYPRTMKMTSVMESNTDKNIRVIRCHSQYSDLFSKQKKGILWIEGSVLTMSRPVWRLP